MNWILIIVVSGQVIGLGGVTTTPMTEDQCKASIEVLTPLKGALGAACIGPNGEIMEMAR